MTLYHNEGTPIGMNDCVASRLRFDHYGSQHVSKLVTSGVSTDRQLSQPALVACGPMCDSSACSLTKARAPNRGAPKDPERRRATANFNHVATDVYGSINPSSSGGLRSGNESVFVPGKQVQSFLQPARDHTGDLRPIPTLEQWARGVLLQRHACGSAADDVHIRLHPPRPPCCSELGRCEPAPHGDGGRTSAADANRPPTETGFRPAPRMRTGPPRRRGSDQRRGCKSDNWENLSSGINSPRRRPSVLTQEPLDLHEGPPNGRGHFG
jgi:hypothetical protein